MNTNRTFEMIILTSFFLDLLSIGLTAVKFTISIEFDRLCEQEEAR